MPNVKLRQYQLEVKIGGRWKALCIIPAPDHRAAFGKAMVFLSPDLYDKTIRLEEVRPAKAPKPARGPPRK